MLVFAFVGIVWACYPLLTIPVYSGDAKIWVHSDTEVVSCCWQITSSHYPRYRTDQGGWRNSP